ncbi:MAG: efflux RND transporter permease subunit [Alistipes sp.]|jgi:multidrug efflux pump subunit AcrB|nr:efflux RND transporter permease subunit [Alistipes sp.]
MSYTGGEIRGVRRISAFSVILIMVVLMVVGAAMMPLLKVQYTPSDRREGFSVSFGWPGVSARVVESEVTSKIEGVLNSIEGVTHITATSRKGGGRVWLGFKKGTRMDAARFEVATQIRQIYSKLPAGVSYPYIDMSLGGSSSRNIITYTINADLPPYLIVKWAEENLSPALSRIAGVESVNLSGATPFEWIVTFDANLARDAGITVDDIAAALGTSSREDIVGNFTDGDRMQTIRLTGDGGDATDLENTPVKKVGDRIYHLRDIATVQYRESLPRSYFRINGLNTIYMTFGANEGINTIEVAGQIRESIARLTPTLPPNYTLHLAYDVSEVLRDEIDTILFRSVLSLIILLGFVWLVSRSLRYLALIALSIVVNLLVAVIFYYLFGVEIQLYSLAGITVSLGIIIDTSIVMIDHYSYYRNRRVFTSILGALLTTIAALLVIFFLPDQQKANLVDFVWVIVINLSISVVIAFMFIPSLLEKIPIRRRGVVRTRTTGRRRIARFSLRYERFIVWGRRPRHRWIFIVLLLGGFAGSFWFFAKGYRPESFFRTPEPRKSIHINAGMPEGCSVHQLNDVMRAMENYLAQYDEIDTYQTSVNSYNSASITVNFKKEFENTSFPVMLFDELSRQAQSYGGANWYVRGVLPDQFFSNYIGSGGYKSHGIRLKGYNYDMLYRYATELVDSLSRDGRVSDPGIFSDNRYSTPENEFFITYDREKIARAGLDLGGYWRVLREQLFDQQVSYRFDGETTTPVVLTSSEKDAFDRWHIARDMVSVDDVATRLDDIGTVSIRRSGNDIMRENQEYRLVVGFNYIGAYELANRRVDRAVKMMNESVLPIGYKAERIDHGWRPDAKDNWRMAGLLALVIIIIYGLCAIIFESLIKPFVILLMIPVGFIGLFLTFAIGRFTFDQGGFAAMVMMCGIVVNAGIYIVHEYNVIHRARQGATGSATAASAVSGYVRAYNRKIVPTLLTIISTVLGLIPFLFDGTDNVFWFAFAVGVMGSMLFSILALVVWLPIFFPLKSKKNGDVLQK